MERGATSGRAGSSGRGVEGEARAATAGSEGEGMWKLEPLKDDDKEATSPPSLIMSSLE
jgi:hypothetical protein